jgi:hypothetical protein
VDGKKVEHEHGYEQQGIILTFVQGFVECLAEIFYRFWRLECRNRLKSDMLFPLSVCFCDDIICVLETSTNFFSTEGVKVTM